MRTTTPSNPSEQPQEKKSGSFRRIFGGEFLLSKQMRPWYPYIIMLFIMMGLLVISEQRILNKKRQIKELEETYKAEITRLKANNQFIPYEENQMLIKKMEARGFVVDESQTYVIKVKDAEKAPKRRLLKRKDKDEKK